MLAVEARHLHVANDEIERLSGGTTQSFVAIEKDMHFEAILLQDIADQTSDGWLIFDDQNSLSRAWGTELSQHRRTHRDTASRQGRAVGLAPAQLSRIRIRRRQRSQRDGGQFHRERRSLARWAGHADLSSVLADNTEHDR